MKRTNKGSVANLSRGIGSLASFCLDILLFSGEINAGKEKFHGRYFPKCIVLQAVFWYLRNSLSYRDIEELMKERGVELDHATVQRWVVKYTPVLKVEFRKKKKN